MSKNDGISDNKINTITGKTNPADAKNNEVNKHYEKALSASPASRREASDARALGVPPKKQKEVTDKKIKERKEKREKKTKLTKHNRASRANKKDLLNNDNDDDILDNDESNKQKMPIIELDNDTSDEQDNDNNNDSNPQSNDVNYRGKHYESAIKRTNNQSLSENSKEYLEFLKNFVNHFDEIPPNEIIIQKAMVQDTIGQMFDEFLAGMDSFEKNTKQHQTFGQAAHLCQKILISLKHDDMPTAQTLIKRLLPKSKG